ncbi:GNAT family N-acetyltransferase [Stutzerimonas kirkiae]|uniref:GNAT family N-acetyltransferase n=1 Tax=Stutzerimonas kirkiae TaxID=2211392 RepID=A0A4Q9RB38_9GAMM|nr:GNAT family N-acetyltransferase [Stutzerimonas kirkiae]TBU97818.1 GNAT family N-acetyltransferase [Stutzerimonas kirkiae]TBV04831.1 GNAT family N-acetyltransferase [Stutzerimonas kirkiae]TBV15024.1 GNAT family N-acetyltransferase [Stutzerimonas kirkiae]
MSIRLATPGDIPALCRLLDQLFAQETEFTPDHAAQTRGLRMIVEHPEVGEILVAEQDGGIVAMVSLLYSVSTALGAPVALLEDMVVDAANRASGFGSQLLDAAIAHARQRGCRRITLLTDSDNHAAQRFYARQGFQPSSMLPMRLLPGQ